MVTKSTDLDLDASIMTGVAIKKAGSAGPRVIDEAGRVLGRVEPPPDPFSQGRTEDDDTRIIAAALHGSNERRKEVLIDVVDKIGALAQEAAKVHADLGKVGMRGKLAVEKRLKELRAQMDVGLKQAAGLIGDFSQNPEYKEFLSSVGDQLRRHEATFSGEGAE